MNKLVSIIVPVFNSEQYIDTCINSIISQTYKNLEIILLNDGSIDNSLQIMKDYGNKDNRIVVINKENTGVSSTRNIGIHRASGEYIMFIDSDDWIDEDYIEKLLLEAERDKLDICRTGFVVEKKNNIKQIINYAKNGDKYINNNFKENFIDTSIFHSACVQLIRTSIIKDNDIKFNENIIYEEDLIFNIKLFMNCTKIKYINIPHYHYRANEESTTRNLDNVINIINSIIIANQEIERLAELSNVYLKSEICTKHLNIIVMYLFILLKKDKKKLKSTCIKIDYKDFSDILKNMNLTHLNLKEKIKVYIIIFFYRFYNKRRRI